MTHIPALSKRTILACVYILAATIVAVGILYSEHVAAQYNGPYTEAGCGATSIPAGLNCMAGEAVFVDCEANQMGYYQVNATTKTCSTNGWSSTDNWGYCQTDARCTTPVACTMTNACGASNTGTVGGDGICSVSAPANPVGYGTSCSTANACGVTNTGTVQCDGSCSASAPALPANYGAACTSAANSCGMTNSGTIGCSGSCSAYVPSDASCPASPTASLSASPTAITQGDTSTLSWSSTNTYACVGAGFSTNDATDGSALVSPDTTSSYGLQCNGTSGLVNALPVTVTVSTAECSGAGPISITASPSRVRQGDSTTLSWSGSNLSAPTCIVRNMANDQVVKTSIVSSCSVSDSAVIDGFTLQSTYRLICGGLRQDIIINTLPKIEEF